MIHDLQKEMSENNVLFNDNYKFQKKILIKILLVKSYGKWLILKNNALIIKI